MTTFNCFFMLFYILFKSFTVNSVSLLEHTVWTLHTVFSGYVACSMFASPNTLKKDRLRRSHERKRHHGNFFPSLFPLSLHTHTHSLTHYTSHAFPWATWNRHIQTISSKPFFPPPSFPPSLSPSLCVPGCLSWTYLCSAAKGGVVSSV